MNSSLTKGNGVKRRVNEETDQIASNGDESDPDNVEPENKKKKKSVSAKNSFTEKSKSTKPLADETKRKRGRPSIVKSSSQNSDKKPDPKVVLQQLKQCKRLINELSKDANAMPFLKAVSTDECPIYNEIIKNPMDIETIKEKIRLDQYAFVFFPFFL